MNDLVLFVVAAPFAAGAVVALAVLALRTRDRATALSFLLPAAALFAYLLNEGLPPLPPLAAKQKLPYLLLMAALAGPLLSTWRSPRAPPRWLLAAVAIAASLFWVGKSVALGRPLSVQGVDAYALGLVGLAALVVAARSGSEGRAESVLVAAAAFWQTIGGAVAALLAPYVGAAQTLGAWAATLGGFMLVAYVARLAGRSDALSLPDLAGFNAAWVSFLLLMMPLMFATSGSRSTFVIAEFSGLSPLFFTGPGGRLASLPDSLRPIALGVAPAIPASIAVGVAAFGRF